MNNLVTPKTYFVGFTSVEYDNLTSYLRDSDQLEFLESIEQAKQEGLSDGEILCSFYAKLCYSALKVGVNRNITRVRGIYDNITGTIDSGHGSVIEHCNLNFITRNCSRILTHELVRHRTGTAFSQQSGRYVRVDKLDFVHDPILNFVKDEIQEGIDYIQNLYTKIEQKIGINDIKDFGLKKKLTSAMRRILPNGQSNEIGFSLNLRTLRHTIQMRTSRHAEWEIRLVFSQIYELVKNKYPAIFADAKEELIDEAKEITFKNSKI